MNKGADSAGTDDMRRVVIVDDDAWMRRGRAAWLSEAPGIEVIAVLTPDAALSFDNWDRCDVALVDAWDEREAFDRFPGVSVVETIRAARTSQETTVVVLSGHVFDDLLRLRMAEAGADYFYGNAEVRDLDDLVAVITRPEEGRRVTPGDPDRLAQLGLSEASRPNAALRHISETGMEDAFAPGALQRDLPLSRRRIITARKRLASLGRLPPGPPSKGARSTPEWRSVVRFVNWARGAGSSDDPKD